MVGLPVGLAILAALYVSVLLLRNFLVICRPNEIVVIEGRRTKLPDGSTRDYAVIDAGRAFRIPVIENARSMELSTMTVDMHIQNAYSRGNIPLSVHAIANVKICRTPGVIDNALERFLGRSQEEIREVAKETIEGALRGVLARLTPEQVNEERATFVNVLANDVEGDLNQLGLTIDTLNIQSVVDSVNYLDNIGRERIANVVMEAEVAEFEFQREAEEVSAESRATGKVAQETAIANIRRAENALERDRAHLDGKARQEEERTERAPVEARARAEVKLQELLARVEAFKLQADEVLPAEANQVADRLRAEGDAAQFQARGEANAEALRLTAKAWSDAGDNAEDIMMLEQLDELISQVAEQIGQVEVEKINLVDGGDGSTLGRLAGAYPQMVASVFDQVGAATGISLNDLMQRPIKAVKPSSKLAKKVGPFQDPLGKRNVGRFSARRFGEERPDRPVTEVSAERSASSKKEAPKRSTAAPSPSKELPPQATQASKNKPATDDGESQ